MEQTFSNLMLALMKGYEEGKVKKIEVVRYVGVKEEDNYNAISVIINEDKDEEYSGEYRNAVLFNDDKYKYKELRSRPKSFYDEEDYTFTLEALERARCI